MRFRHAAALLVLHVAVAGAFLAQQGPGFPLDDTWIHLVYARALGLGQGFAYNPGQLETGVTAPLWTSLLAVPVAVVDAWGLRPDGAVRLLGLLAGWALSCAGFALAGRAGRLPALFAGVGLTLDPLLVFDRFSGLEQPLFGCLSLLLIGALLHRKERRAGLLAGALLLTRPEALVLVAVAAFQIVARRGRLLLFLGPLVLCLLPWLTYCQLVSGRPWPSTLENKAELVFDLLAAGQALFAVLADGGWGWALPLALGVGIYVLEGGQHELGRLPVLCAALLLPAVALTRPLELAQGAPAGAPPVPYYWARYVLLAWPLLVFVASVGVSSLARTAFAGLRCRPAWAVVLIGPLVIWMLCARGLPAHGRTVLQRFAEQCEDTELLQVAAGQWIDEHLPPEALVASHDAGALRWFGRRPLLDLWGNHSGGLRAALAKGGEASAVAWLADQEPVALAVFPVLYAKGHAQPELAELWRAVPPHEYEGLLQRADDYASFFGLTRRAATFHLPRPPAVVPSPLHASLAIFVRP